MSDNLNEEAVRKRSELRKTLLEGGIGTIRWAICGGLVSLVAFAGVFTGFMFGKDKPGWEQIAGFLGVLAALLILLVALVWALARITQMGTD